MVNASHTHLLSLLKTHFGYDTFRSPQDEIVSSILSNRDTFVLMPTGAGKSLCYQLPALAFPGLTVVISPLIALMKDQVDHLTAHGIPAGCVNSTMSREQLQETARKVNDGKIKLLYLSPERLAITRFQQWLQRKDVSLIAIDEAHCISEWGHDFRPDYRGLTNIRKIFPNVPIIALTATAIPKVRQDIVSLLQLQNPQTFQTSFNRENLHYVLRNDVDKWEEMTSWLKKYQGESVVIYCLSRKSTEQVASDLQQVGFSAVAYHAGLDKDKRTSIQDQFLKDKVQIVVATIAFGMGIDKPNIRLVIHYDMPKSMEGYYQETGRAGRDGLDSHCVLFFDESSPNIYWRFINRMEDEHAKKMSEQKLNQMITFCESNSCRRKWVLEYFAEEYDEKNCESCDACAPELYESQVAVVAESVGYHKQVLTKLKQLRLKLADMEGVPAFVIFGDQSLVEMATYLPTSLEMFDKISGVGEYKLERYGKVFTKLIRQLSEKYDLASVSKPKRSRTQKPLSLKPSQTHTVTKHLLDQGLTLEEIAEKREISLNTVLNHLEKITSNDKSVKLDHLEIDEKRLKEITLAIKKIGAEKLRPIRDELGDEYSYDEIRLARILYKRESGV